MVMIQFRKIFVLGGLLIITSLSCHKEKPICGCGTEDPLRNIEWLNSAVTYYNNDTNQNWDEVNIYMYDYKNSNAFVFDTKKIGLYDVPMTIFDCKGKTLFICGGLQPPQLDSCNIFYKSASNKTLVWSKKY